MTQCCGEIHLDEKQTWLLNHRDNMEMFIDQNQKRGNKVWYLMTLCHCFIKREKKTNLAHCEVI